MSEFDEVLTAAVEDIATAGYLSEAQIDQWLMRLRQAAVMSLIPESELVRRLQSTLNARFAMLVERGTLLRYHPGVARFTLERVRPQLRAELDRRIAASASLIRLNREDAIASTLQRFQAWATSVPMGGTDRAVRRETKYDVKRSLSSLPFRERRVLIDQGQKLTANLSEILAVDGGAIAGVWRSRWPRGGVKPPHYDARVEHHERDSRVYLVRGSWAKERGLVQPDPKAGYIDEITRPGEEVYCSCRYEWVHALRDLPQAMLTTKGVEELARVRGKAA